MVLILAATLAASALAASAPAFQHPAGWHRASDIARIRAKIESGAEPWKSAAELLLNDTSLLASYKPAPVSLVCRTCCKVACCAPGKKCPGEASSGSMVRLLCARGPPPVRAACAHLPVLGARLHGGLLPDDALGCDVRLAVG